MQSRPIVVSHVTPKSSFPGGAVNTPTHAFNVQLRKSVEQINKEVKLGKLNKTQAQPLMKQVKAIKGQELEFFKDNGNKQLTTDQLTQLNTLLAKVSASL